MMSKLIVEHIGNLYKEDGKILNILDKMSNKMDLQQETIQQLQAKIAELEGKIQSGEQ